MSKLSRLKSYTSIKNKKIDSSNNIRNKSREYREDISFNNKYSNSIIIINISYLYLVARVIRLLKKFETKMNL